MQIALEPIVAVAAEHLACATAIVVARDQAGDDAERRKCDVEQVVGRVDRDQAEHVLAIDEPDDRDQAVHHAERKRHGSSGSPLGRGGEQDEAGGDVDYVVDRVDLEAEEQAALDAVTGVEARVRDEPKDSGQQ